MYDFVMGFTRFLSKEQFITIFTRQPYALHIIMHCFADLVIVIMQHISIAIFYVIFFHLFLGIRQLINWWVI